MPTKKQRTEKEGRLGPEDVETAKRTKVCSSLCTLLKAPVSRRCCTPLEHHLHASFLGNAEDHAPRAVAGSQGLPAGSQRA